MTRFDSRTALGILVMLCACMSWSAQAQETAVPEDAPPGGEDARGAMFRNVGRLIRSFQQLGNWDEQHAQMMNAVETMFDRQGWNSESDQFSMELIRTVESVPPWAVQERFDTMVGLLSDRYMLDEPQERQLRQKMMNMSNDVFQAHSDRIIKYAVEAIQTRASGEGFSAEQVQRWAELAEPVFDDMRGRVNQAAREFSRSLDPEQREQVEKDLAAANRRMQRVHELGQQWKRGEWTPADWGMENDPIQVASDQRHKIEWQNEQKAPDAEHPVGTEGQRADAPQPEGRPEPGAQIEDGAIQPGGQGETGQPGQQPSRVAMPNPAQNDPWGGYVQAFIQKFQLNHEQAQRGWQIYNDVRTRRDTLQVRFDRKRSDSAEIAASTTQANQHQATLARLFEQMTRRLERLPTRAQRKDALPMELPVVVQRPAPASAAKPKAP